MNRRDFIKSCACCFSMLMLTACSRRFPQDIYNLFDGFQIPHIDVHLVEHCNLNCKYCSHFSNIAEKEFYNVEKFEQDMQQLSKITESKISNIQLLGGEPLLHPDIEKLFDITRKYFPKSAIDLLTNGLLLDSQKKSFWLSMNKNNIYLCPSLYPININWKSVLKKAKKYHVYVATDGRDEELTLDNIPSHTVHSFYKLNLDFKGEQQWKKGSCPYGPSCANFTDGKLYPCFVISNIRHFNKKFNKNLPVTEKDYIDIYKTKSMDEIEEFWNEKIPVPFCKYCAPFTPNLAWEPSSNHTLDEWVK